jgi:hypothetical protein
MNTSADVMNGGVFERARLRAHNLCYRDTSTPVHYIDVVVTHMCPIPVS